MATADADPGASCTLTLMPKLGKFLRQSWRSAIEPTTSLASIAPSLIAILMADVIVLPQSTAVLGQDAETTATQRDRHLQSTAQHRRMGRQKTSYTRQASLGTAIRRLKRLIGDTFSRTDQRRGTVCAIAVHASHRTLELGRPKSGHIV